MLGISESVLSKSELEEQEEAKYYMQLAKKRIKTFINEPYLDNIALEIIIQNYKIFSEVNSVAKEQNADLIVMGSHGASGLRTFFVGSNTEKVVRTADIPVLVIKKRHQSFQIKTVLFACDLKPENSHVYHKVAEYANSTSAKLHVIYVNTNGINFLSNSQLEEKITKFSSLIKEKPLIKIYNDYSVELGIFNYARSINANLVAIPTHGRRGLSHFFMGSIGESLANQANLPIMTIKI